MCLVTADHGNAEQMLEPDGVSPHTAHTTNPVPLVVTDERSSSYVETGGLSDLAPTILGMLGVPIPGDMTGTPLATGAVTGPRRKPFTQYRSILAAHMSLPQPDLGVLRKAQRGDERAFSIIVRTYEQPVYNYVLRLTGDRSPLRGSDAGGLPPRLPGPAELLAPLALHDVAVPGHEEPRARRAARDRAPSRAPS